MEDTILTDINSYSGGSEVGIEHVYSKSETAAEYLDEVYGELNDSNSTIGLMSSLEGMV